MEFSVSPRQPLAIGVAVLLSTIACGMTALAAGVAVLADPRAAVPLLSAAVAAALPAALLGFAGAASARRRSEHGWARRAQLAGRVALVPPLVALGVVAHLLDLLAQSGPWG